MVPAVSRHNGNASSYSKVPGSRHVGNQSRLDGGGSGGGGGGGGGGMSMNPLCCNRCIKPLVATLFVCKCNCVFCEDCTYSHFQNSDTCPSCGTALGPDDFTDVCISNRPTGDGVKEALQELLTKGRPDASHLGMQDMCKQAVRSLDTSRRNFNFLLKQMLGSHGRLSRKANEMSRAYKKLQTEYTKLQQSSAADQREFQQNVSTLENRVLSLTNRVSELEAKLVERDRLLSQFRQRCADQSAPASFIVHPGSSSSQRSGSTAVAVVPPMQAAFAQNRAMAQQTTAANRMGGSSGRRPAFLGSQSRAPFSASPIQNNSVDSRLSTSGYNFGHRQSGGSGVRLPGMALVNAGQERGPSSSFHQGFH